MIENSNKSHDGTLEEQVIVLLAGDTHMSNPYCVVRLYMLWWHPSALSSRMRSAFGKENNLESRDLMWEYELATSWRLDAS